MSGRAASSHRVPTCGGATDILPERAEAHAILERRFGDRLRLDRQERRA
jgi:hypothetical protein